jgi:TolB protein
MIIQTKLRHFLRTLALMLLACTVRANAFTHIDITKANIAPVPLALQVFSSNASGGGDYYINGVEDVVKSDLISSGLFRIIDSESYIEEPLKNLNTVPTFLSWRQINAHALVQVSVIPKGSILDVTLSVWDIYTEKQLILKKFTADDKNWRRIAHKISDEIYKKFTGEPGYFDTKIAYVEVQQSGRNKIRRIAIMDHDGANNTYLTDGRNIVLTPRFAPNSHSLIYFTYEDRLKPKVKSLDLNTKKSTLLREFPGMAYAPRYTPNGEALLLAIEKKGVSNIYFYNPKSMEMTQITSCTSICTSPSSSPTQRHIVFNSDMGGGRNLYVIDSNGKNIRRISFGNGKYTNPVWSPRGDLIAFTKMVSGEGFYIGVMRPDGSDEKIISSGYLVEGPAWAPNGRALIFERQVIDGSASGGTKLYKVDVLSRKEHEINTKFSATDANWSALLD